MKLLTRLIATIVFASTGIACADPLPSWNKTEARDRIIAFVESVTDVDSGEYVTPSERIAVFDNDGTLWGEQPVYFQLIYAITEVKKMAANDPSILTSDALKAAAEGDIAALSEAGEAAILEVIDATHSGMSVEDFQASVADWLATAQHPTTGLSYEQMTYQPMVELLRYLRDEDFKTYIVSGGGLHFMRAFAERAYGISIEQVIGSYSETSYKMVDGTSTIIKEPGNVFYDDKDGKVINIERIIGQRPVIAVGNSDGDFAMIEWTTAGDGARLGMLVHHTDADREVAYDCNSHVGQLCDGLEKGPDMGWLIVDIARDWSVVHTGDR